MRYSRYALSVLVALMVQSSAGASETVSYSYDAQGRLVQVVHSGGPINGTQTIYTQDAASNRTRVQVAGAPH